MVLLGGTQTVARYLMFRAQGSCVGLCSGWRQFALQFATHPHPTSPSKLLPGLGVLSLHAHLSFCPESIPCEQITPLQRENKPLSMLSVDHLGKDK